MAWLASRTEGSASLWSVGTEVPLGRPALGRPVQRDGMMGKARARRQGIWKCDEADSVLHLCTYLHTYIPTQNGVPRYRSQTPAGGAGIGSVGPVDPCTMLDMASLS